MWYYVITPFCFKVMFLIRLIFKSIFLWLFLALLVSVFKWRALRYLTNLVSSCLILFYVAYDASHLSQVYAKGEVLAPKYRPKIARWKSWLDNIANTMQMKGFFKLQSLANLSSSSKTLQVKHAGFGNKNNKTKNVRPTIPKCLLFVFFSPGQSIISFSVYAGVWFSRWQEWHQTWHFLHRTMLKAWRATSLVMVMILPQSVSRSWNGGRVGSKRPDSCPSSLIQRVQSEWRIPSPVYIKHPIVWFQICVFIPW